MREGDDRDARPLPLLVRLPSADMAMNILRQRQKLPRSISITSDRTKAERGKIAEVRAAMLEHNAANPGNPMRLKFVGGEPTLVSDSSSSPAPEISIRQAAKRKNPGKD